MKYCTQCGSEYQDNTKLCADCGGTELVSAEEMHRRKLLLPHELDQREFVVAGTAEDPLMAERLVQLLEGADIAAFLRARSGGTIDNLTTSAAPWWEILTTEESAPRASELIQKERARLEENAEEATRAAEEEEAEQEGAGSKS